MELINPSVQAYAEKYSSPQDTLLKEISDYTTANHPRFTMLSGHLQGKWLQMVSFMLRPQRILEIGTFTGYSAICLASGLTGNGKLHSIELRPEETATSRAFIERSAYADKIELHTGNALEIIPSLEEEWDLVFIDADKVSYIEYFNLVFPKVRKNGFILADNVFFHGEVLEETLKGKNAKAIQAFNDFIHQRSDIDKMMLTLRDGLFLLRKL